MVKRRTSYHLIQKIGTNEKFGTLKFNPWFIYLKVYKILYQGAMAELSNAPVVFYHAGGRGFESRHRQMSFLLRFCPRVQP